MQELEIRAAKPDDLKSIEAVFTSHSPGYDWKLAEKYYRSYFAEPEAHEDEVVLVGASGGAVVGVIGYLHDWHEAPGIFWLGWFYMHKDHQAGHGKKLLDHVIVEVKRRGARKLYTDTSSWGVYERVNHRYRELGFKEEATLQDFYQKGEHQVIYGMDLA